MPESERTGPVTSGTGSQISGGQPATFTLNVPQATDIPRGRAYAGPPVPGRGLWAVTVLSCPLCEGMHQHRVGQVTRLLSGQVYRSCPTTRRPYRLAPVTRRREARRAA